MAKESGVELFRSPSMTPYVTFREGGHAETWPLDSAKFRLWLVHRFYNVVGKVLGDAAFKQARAVLEAEALFEGEVHQVHLRVAEVQGAIYLDLANSDWQVVRISPDGWELLDESPVKFIRAAATRPLPVPERGGSIDELRQFVNLTDDDYVLALGWLVAALRPRGPYPVLTINGEQGSAKSTTSRVLRALIDPNEAPLRSKARTEEDLMVVAKSSHVMALDNISHLSADLSDALCRISSGGAFAGRKRYTDADESIVTAQRPVLINGISDLVTRSDLLERSVILNAPVIATEERLPEEVFWQHFEARRPKILGALLSALASGVERLPFTQVDDLPRMADYALWASACEEALGFASGEFMRVYREHLKEGHLRILEMSPLVPAIIGLLDETAGEVVLTPTDLKQKLDGVVDPSVSRQSDWPRSVTAMTQALRRLSPNLREIGIGYDELKSNGSESRRYRRLYRLPVGGQVEESQTPEEDYPVYTFN